MKHNALLSIAGGTAVYTVRLQAEYTQVYTEETT